MGPLFLIGYMGCGKSTLGRKVARRLDLPFFDTDTLVEAHEGASVADIFQFEGEERFRKFEHEALEGVLGGGVCVVSTGGGLPTWADNMECMNGAGVTVYLRRTPECIASRLSPYGRQKRPRFRGLDDEQLLEFMTRNMAEREPFYRRAHYIVDCSDLSDEMVVCRIVEIMKNCE